MADQTDQPEVQPTDTMQTTPSDHVVTEDAPKLPSKTTVREWIKENLFKDVRNSILTIIFGGILGYAGFRTFRFLFANEKTDLEGNVRSGWEILQFTTSVVDGETIIRDDAMMFLMVGNRFQETGIDFSFLWAGVYLVALTLGLLIGLNRKVDAPKARLGTLLGIAVPPVLGAVVILGFTNTITPTILTLLIPVAGYVGRLIGIRLPMALRKRIGWIVFGMVLLAFGLLTGFNPTNINRFGGLLLTITISFAAIVLCFPVGVMMALARRSSFPLIRPIAVAYIELIRGVPLISLLFMGEFALRFFFPPNVEPPGSIPRAIIMITLFTGAYVAEVVRGGLQSVPAGQTEAGQAVGLSPVQITRKIVLPQALRNSIPPLIGQFISVLKDTSLLIIIGQLDLLGVTKPLLQNRLYVNQGFTTEAYVFVGFLFWVITFSMSRASQRLETRLGVRR